MYVHFVDSEGSKVISNNTVLNFYMTDFKADVKKKIHDFFFICKTCDVTKVIPVKQML